MNRKKVLAIDDEPIVLDSVREILTQEGLDVTTTLDGREGIQWAISDHFDIVLTDVRMPTISGKIVLREIKRAKPAVPVIIITGYTSVQTAIQSLKLGAAHVLEKPFTPDELVHVVKTALQKGDQAEPQEQGLVNENEIRKILKHAADNPKFAEELAEKGTDVLDDYDLTAAEKLALLTGDVKWFEGYLGVLPPKLRKYFELNAEPLSS